MDIAKLFSIVNTYEGFNFTLWNIYIVVVLGIIGYAIGGDKVQRIGPRLILMIAFFIFAFGNSQYLERNLILIKAAATEIKTIIDADNKISIEFKESISDWVEMQPSSLLLMHYTIDVAVILLVLFGPYLTASIKRNSISGNSVDDP